MSIGVMQLLLILIIIFVLFGAGKLPKMMGDVGKGIKNLKDGMDNKSTSSEPTQTDTPTETTKPNSKSNSKAAKQEEPKQD